MQVKSVKRESSVTEMIELKPGKVPKRYARWAMVVIFGTLGIVNLIASVRLGSPIPLIFFVCSIPNVVVLRRQIRRSINPE